MDEITHVINTVLKCKHQDDLSYESQNWPLHFFTLSDIQDTGLIGMLMPKEESENFKLFLMELKHIL